MLVDMEGTPMCRAGQWSETAATEWADWQTAEALETQCAHGPLRCAGKEREIRGVSALAAGERRFAAILLGAGEFFLGDVDARTVERAALVGALLFLSDEAVAEAEYRAQGDVVRDLLSPSTTGTGLWRSRGDAASTSQPSTLSCSWQCPPSSGTLHFTGAESPHLTESSSPNTKAASYSWVEGRPTSAPSR